MNLFRIVLLLVGFTASLSAACGGGPGGSVCGFQDFEMGAGYTFRDDHLKYKIENSCSRIKRERHFNNVDSNQFTAYAKGLAYNHFYFRGYGDYGWVDRGTSKEKVYFDDILIFEQKGCVSEVCTYDVSLAIGYQLDFCSTNFRVAPLFGYSWHVQYFRTHANKLVYDIDNFLPACRKLKYKEDYKPNWYGPWIGLDAEYECYCNWVILVGLEYHWPEYQAKFRRNHVVVDDVDFPEIDRKDYGCGEGFIGNIGLRNDFCQAWSLLVMCSFQTWHLNHGLAQENVDHSDFHSYSKVENVRWNSVQATVAIAYHF